VTATFKKPFTLQFVKTGTHLRACQSNPAKGSSSSSSEGARTSCRAKAKRRCCPPDRALGGMLNGISDSPTASITCASECHRMQQAVSVLNVRKEVRTTQGTVRDVEGGVRQAHHVSPSRRYTKQGAKRWQCTKATTLSVHCIGVSRQGT
jgi:hypothetical protein